MMPPGCTPMLSTLLEGLGLRVGLWLGLPRPGLPAMTLEVAARVPPGLPGVGELVLRCLVGLPWWGQCAEPEEAWPRESARVEGAGLSWGVRIGVARSCAQWGGKYRYVASHTQQAQPALWLVWPSSGRQLASLTMRFCQLMPLVQSFAFPASPTITLQKYRWRLLCCSQFSVYVSFFCIAALCV